MKAISYLIAMNVKNAILDTIRHPLRLILYLIIIFGMAYGAVMGFTAGDTDAGEFIRGITAESHGRLLNGAYLAVLFFISIPVMLKGLSSGTSFFSLSDVHNLFVAPVSTRLILMYGIGRQLATMLILLITFAAYGGMLINTFNLAPWETLLLIVGIGLMLILVQLTTLIIFSLASCHPKRAAVMKYIIYATAFGAIGIVVGNLFIGGITLENTFRSISLPVLEYIPIAGWMHGFIFGILEQNSLKMLIYGLLMILMIFGSIIALYNFNTDFFEDVLSGAEDYHEFRENIRSGKVSEAAMFGDGKKLKKGKLGINRGYGASTIFFKHLREGARRSKIMFFNINTVVLMLIVLVIGLGMRIAMSEVNPTIIYLAVSIIGAYVQFFFSAASDWVKELTKPYIYLIPDNPVKKLVMAAATGLIKPFTDGIVSFLILAIFIRGEIPDIITAALMYGSFGSIYIAANVLAQRLVGIDSTGGVFITLYMSLIVLTLLPGVILGVVCLSEFAVVFGNIATTLFDFPIFSWNMLVSAIIFLSCRNLLNNTE